MDFPEQDLDIFGEDSDDDNNGPRRSVSSSPSSSSSSSGSSSSSSSAAAAASSPDGPGGGQSGSSASSGEEEENCGETADSRFYNENDDYEDYEETDLFGSDNEDYFKTLAIIPYPIPGARVHICMRVQPCACKECYPLEMFKLSYSHVNWPAIVVQKMEMFTLMTAAWLFKRHIPGYVGVDLNEGFDTFIEKKILQTAYIGEALVVHSQHGIGHIEDANNIDTKKPSEGYEAATQRNG